MAEALDLDSVAADLLELELVQVQAGVITIDDRLRRAGTLANTETLARIARTVLSHERPPWLAVSVSGNTVQHEWLPLRVQRDLEWLGELLDPILVHVRDSQSREGVFRRWLGSAGESLIVAIERNRGRSVRHVAKLSDAFGFDVESCGPTDRKCIEVKTCLESGAERFFISRHEVDTSIRLGEQWLLIQVTLRAKASTDDSLDSSHVVDVQLLAGRKVWNLGPRDSPTGVWLDAARIRAASCLWSKWDFGIPETWSFPGYREYCAANL